MGLEMELLGLYSDCWHKKWECWDKTVSVKIRKSGIIKGNVKPMAKD